MSRSLGAALARCSHSSLAAIWLSLGACGDSSHRGSEIASDAAPVGTADGGMDGALPAEVDGARALDAAHADDGQRDAAGDGAEDRDAHGNLDAAAHGPHVADAGDPAEAAQDASIPGDPGAATPEADGGAGLQDASVGLTDGGGSCDPSQPPQVGRLGLRAVITSSTLAGLTDAVQPPDSPDWYLVEQRGRIVILRDGSLLPEPFLDLTSEIVLNPPPAYEDRGLVSLAFAPDYATSGRFYVALTPTAGAQGNFDLLLEFTRAPGSPDRAAADSRRTIVEVRGTGPASTFLRDIHNGGRVTFGPDGMLYFALGDGGGINCGDIEPDAAQNISSPFGKLLRLDLSQPAPYAAADNPFVADGDARVLHYGLRNPFRYSFDRLTGDLYIGDVGQNRYEEIDYAPRGARGLNFGWAAYEGMSRDTCPNRQLRAGATHTAPIFVADRRASATSPFSDYTAMIGGAVYRGSALPELAGAYVFGGYQGRRLGALYQCGDRTSQPTPILKSCDPNAPNAACLHSLAGAPVFRELRAIVEDHAGELYVVANGDSLLKIVRDE